MKRFVVLFLIIMTVGMGAVGIHGILQQAPTSSEGQLFSPTQSTEPIFIPDKPHRSVTIKEPSYVPPTNELVGQWSQSAPKTSEKQIIAFSAEGSFMISKPHIQSQLDALERGSYSLPKPGLLYLEITDEQNRIRTDHIKFEVKGNNLSLTNIYHKGWFLKPTKAIKLAGR